MFMDSELKAIEFTKEQKALIKGVMESPEFNHVDWSNDSLESLRSSIRNHYRNAQNSLCCYCKNPVSLTSAANCQVEHIAPKSRYKDFIFTAKNLCVVCADCNSAKQSFDVIKPLPSNKKRTRYPTTSQFLIVHPHFDIYSEHIRKFGERFYFPRTKKGENTRTICKLDRGIEALGYFDSPESLKNFELIAQIMDATVKKDTNKKNILKKLLIESI